MATSNIESCLDENTIQAFVEGLLGDDARGRAESHIDGCRDCRVLLGEAVRQIEHSVSDASDTREFSTQVDLERSAGEYEPRHAPGDMLGDIRVMRLLGRGGMGDVYLARDTKLGRKIALKVIRPSLARSEKALRKFQKEAQLTARLNHPNIVTIHGVGEHRGAPWLALEYVEGRSLRERIDELRAQQTAIEQTARGTVPKAGVGPAGAAEAARVALSIAQALAHAHNHDVFHLDLKPDNVLIGGDGRVRVVDFGLSKLAVGDEHKSAAGTPHYMAPEQWASEPHSRTDIWALGVTLYLLLSGQRPFDGDSINAIKALVCSDAPGAQCQQSRRRAGSDGQAGRRMPAEGSRRPAERTAGRRRVARDLGTGASTGGRRGQPVPRAHAVSRTGCALVLRTRQ